MTMKEIIINIAEKYGAEDTFAETSNTKRLLEKIVKMIKAGKGLEDTVE